ncbi:30S ribosome-binding factor RbfA [bacterium]|nr:30S ribosome-binding factor RbfA [bacterium]
MKSRRLERLASQFVREISDILKRKLSDPRLQWITVTRVCIAPDLKAVKIYIQTLDTGEKHGQALQALKHATGYIRHELGQRLKLRVVPEMQFLPDVVGEQTAKVFRILEDLNSERGWHDDGTTSGA